MCRLRIFFPVSRLARSTSRCTVTLSPIAVGSSVSVPCMRSVLPWNVSVGARDVNTTLESLPSRTVKTLACATAAASSTGATTHGMRIRMGTSSSSVWGVDQ